MIEERRLVRTIGQMATVRAGRNRVARDNDEDEIFRVLRAADIQSVLPAYSELEKSTRRKRNSAEIKAGDLVGTMSGAYGRWALVPVDYGAVLASDHTVVIRPEGAISARYLLGFLRSSTGERAVKGTLRGSVILRIGIAELKAIEVPALTDVPQDYVDRALGSFSTTLGRVQEDLYSMRRLQDSIYSAESDSAAVARIDQLHGVSAAISTVGLGDARWMVANSFPYPIARAIRAIDRAFAPREKYHELVHQGLEVVCSVLAAVSAATARAEHQFIGGPLRNWASASRRLGPTIGSNLSMIAHVASRLRGDIGGLKWALENEFTPARQLLRELLVERNRIHGDHPLNDYEFHRRINDVEDTYRGLLDSLAFLARWELRLVESVEPVVLPNGCIAYSTMFRVLRGGNPDWAVRTEVAADVRFRGRIYAMVDGVRTIELYPYMLADYCLECGQREIYVVSSFTNDGVRLVSIDRGHRQDRIDAQLLSDLDTAYSLMSG